MHLPELPVKIPQHELQIYKLQGIDRTDNFNEGSLSDCKNITSKRYPYYTTKNRQSIYPNYHNATALYAWGELLVVNNGRVYYGGIDCGALNSDDIQCATVNTKIVILSKGTDKGLFCLDVSPYLVSPEFSDLRYPISLDPALSYSIETDPRQDTDTIQTMTIYGGASLESMFDNYTKNNYLKVKLIGDNVENSWELFYVTKSSSNGNLVVEFRRNNDELFTTGITYHGFEIEVKIPEFDYICSSDNRIFGCENSTQTIFASELGVPNNYFDISSEDPNSGSWVTNIEGPDPFTGCASIGSSVIFFKEYSIYKILGSAPTEYQYYRYDIDGVKSGCHKSIVTMNDTLYYVSPRGVMRYSGGQQTKISEALGNTPLSNVIATTDGDRLYMYNQEGSVNSLYTFDLKTGEWLREEDREIKDMCRLGSTLFMIIPNLGNGEVWFSTNLPIDDDWYIQFNDMFESVFNNYGNRTGTIINKKRYSKLILRVEMAKDSYATVKIRCDDGRWKETGKIAGKSGVFTHAVPINRCDKFGIRIEGHGEFTLLAMQRQYIGQSVREE